MMASPIRLYSGAVASLSEYCPTVPPLLHQHLFLQVCFVILQFLCYTRFLQLICYACPSLFRWGVFCFGASFPNPSAVLIIEVVLQPFSVPFPSQFFIRCCVDPRASISSFSSFSSSTALHTFHYLRCASVLFMFCIRYISEKPGLCPSARGLVCITCLVSKWRKGFILSLRAGTPCGASSWGSIVIGR